VIRALRQWAARRRLARIRNTNIARINAGPARDRLGRFTKEKIA